MRIACFQGPKSADTPSGNLARLRRAAAEAKAGGGALLVCPEMFLTGYALGKSEVARLAEPLDGLSVDEARKIAADIGIALVFGMPERSGDHVFNSAVAIGADGSLLAGYRKTHLFGDVDREQFSAGRAEPDTFDVGGVKIGLLICYDVEFPEAVRALALQGVELVLVPTAVMQPFDVVPRIIVPARAYENQLFIAYADRCGKEADFDYCGLSCVVGPDGVDLARAGRGEELIFADIDKTALARSRKLNPYLKDRRPELYGRVAATPESPT
jgi:predicted amidohydrolase